MYKTIIVHVVLYGCETWSLALKEKHRLRVFENRVLRRIYEPRREDGEDCIMRSFITCTSHQILLGLTKLGRMRLSGHVERMGEKFIQYFFQNT
jgi:hypothetical protein